MKAGSAILALAAGVERLINAISVIAAWVTVGLIALFSVVQVADRKCPSSGFLVPMAA